MAAANNALDKNALPLLAAAVFVGRAGKVAWDAYKLYRAARTVSNEIMSLEEFMAQREGAQMDADPEASKPHVESFPEEEARAHTHATPVHESGPSVNSTPIYGQSSSSDKGFDRHDGPDASIFTSDQSDFKIKKEDVVKTYTHPKFGKFYEMKDGLVYSKDRAGHGGSVWKQFDKTAKGFEWRADLDAYGKRMESKHKGDSGKFIPKKEFSTNGGGK